MMKENEQDRLMDAIGEIDERTVAMAHGRQRAAPVWRWAGAAAACVALALLAAVLLRPTGTNEPEKPSPHGGGTTALAAYAVARSVYPDTPLRPSEDDWEKGDDYVSELTEQWCAAQRARQTQSAAYAGTLEGFLRRTAPVFLSGEAAENRLYSPVNVYLALAMLAELTDGNSRGQILALLDAPDIETVRQRAKALWAAQYQNDGLTACVLAASVWLADDLTFVPETLHTLAQDYYASSFRGEMGSPELDAALQAWLNEQTGGLLEEQVSGVTLSPETVLALATTVYFRTQWSQKFYDGNTAPDTFHAAGGDVTCDFMHQYDTLNTVYAGEGFAALALDLESGGKLWLLLPEEGVTPEELVQNGEATDFLLADKSEWAERNTYLVDLSLPKFDVSSETDLGEGLRSLGVTDVFDDALSDFTPMTTDMTGIYVSQASHAVRVAVDEEGVTAAAFTVIMTCGAALPQGEKYAFTVDRPFFFAITGEDETPLFTGVVHTPAA